MEPGWRGQNVAGTVNGQSSSLSKARMCAALLLTHMPYALLTDPAASGHLLAGLSNGDVWHTTDYGDHWQQLPVNLGSIWTSMIML